MPSGRHKEGEYWSPSKVVNFRNFIAAQSEFSKAAKNLNIDRTTLLKTLARIPKSEEELKIFKRKILQDPRFIEKLYISTKNPYVTTA